MPPRNRHRIDQLTSPRARLIAGSAVVLIAVAFLLRTVSAGSVTDGAEDVSSYQDSTTTLDTSPFEIARPDSTGSTTLPDGMFETTTTEFTDTTLPATTLPPAPTTTLPPTTTTLPIPGRQSDPICQAMVDLITFGREGVEGLDDPAPYAAKVSARLSSWVDQLRAMNVPEYAGAVDKLAGIVTQLRDDPDTQELRLIMANLLRPDERTRPLVAHIMDVCPTILGAR